MKCTCTLENKSSLSDMKVSVLQEMLDEAVALISYAAKNPNEAHMKKWFGDENVRRSRAAIDEGIEQIRQWVKDKKSIKFIARKSMGLGATDQSKDNNEIFLDKGFRMTRYSWGEKVCTMIHEISHKSALKTNDAVEYSGSGEPGGAYYGALCMDLFADRLKYTKAIKNADNWAYYICEYRTAAGVQTSNNAAKWRNFTKRELTARGAFSSLKKDDPQLVDDPALFD